MSLQGKWFFYNILRQYLNIFLSCASTLMNNNDIYCLSNTQWRCGSGRSVLCIILLKSQRNTLRWVLTNGCLGKLKQWEFFKKLPNVTLLPCWRAKLWTLIWYCAVNLMTEIVTKTGIQRACKRSLTSYSSHKTLHEKLYLQQSSMVIIVPPLNFLLSSEQNFLLLLAFSPCNPLFFSEHLFRWKKKIAIWLLFMVIVQNPGLAMEGGTRLNFLALMGQR